MLWERSQSEANPVDKYGLGAFLRRLETAAAGTSGHLEGFTFFEDGLRMLEFSRQIEAAVLQAGGPGPLYVGFQNAAKLSGETTRYGRMREHGVIVYAYGEGTPAPDAATSVEQWNRLDSNHTRLENQWFLVARTPQPIAFVGWEVSADSLWGRLGVSAQGKQFAGFVSADVRVVDAIIHHLDGVRTGRGASAEELAWALEVLIDRIRPKRVMSLVDDGLHPYLRRGLAQTIDGCARAGATLYLYDLSSVSYFTSPYPEENEAEWRRPLQPETLRSFGRGYVADLVEQGQARGVATQAILPYRLGFGHLANWCREQEIDTVVLPVEFTRPSLLQQLQGYTLETLRANATVSVVIEDPDGGARLLWNGEPVRSGVS